MTTFDTRNDAADITFGPNGTDVLGGFPTKKKGVKMKLIVATAIVAGIGGIVYWKTR